MIKHVRSSLGTFHAASFQRRMNIVLAETAADAEDTESTNGLGKTTLIRIIHFCLGGSAARDKVLSHPNLAGASFGLTFEHQGLDVEVDRRTDQDIVSVSQSFIGELRVDIISTEGDRVKISEGDWRLVLSERFVPDAKADKGRDFAPSFREVFLYVARLGKAAFSDPQLSFQSQSGPSKRLIVSYLLSLNWNLQRRLQEDLLSKAQIDQAIGALEGAKTSSDEQTIGDLEAERVVLEEQIKGSRLKVLQFNVRDDYRALEGRLNDIDRELHDLINENHNDKRLLEYYQRSAREVPAASPDEPLEILRSAGAIFKEDALRSLAEVADFHAQIYKNRSEFLKGEVARLKSQLDARSERIDLMADGKSGLLRLLQSSGALENLIELQAGLRDLEIRHEALKATIDERKRFDRRKDEIATSILTTRALLKRDLEDRRQTIDEAVGLFAEYTKFLYGVPGLLSVDIKAAGYSFGFSIDREGSDGVDQMVVFCFDLACATLRARRGAPLTLLIHDSSTFADVDPRQYGHALQLAAEVSEREGFQYICCLNGGALPMAHVGTLELGKFVRLRLDDTETGRLLGFRLPPRDKR